MSGKTSREKGKRGEREIAAILRENGFDGKRGVQYHGGADSPDVVGLAGIHIEVKRVERLDLTKAMAQSIKDMGDNEIPVVFHRKSREPWLVTLTLHDFLNLYKEAK